jgi:hypothetical protein
VVVSRGLRKQQPEADGKPERVGTRSGYPGSFFPFLEPTGQFDSAIGRISLNLLPRKTKVELSHRVPAYGALSCTDHPQVLESLHFRAPKMVSP